MDIVSGRKKVAIAWANPKASGVSMNIDLVQSVAHILVRECFQAKIDALTELAMHGESEGKRDERGRETVLIVDIGSRIANLKSELEKHESAGVATKRTFESQQVSENNT